MSTRPKAYIPCLTLAQVVISPFVGSSPASGCVLTAQSLEPASDSVSSSLSSSPTPSLSLKNKKKKKLHPSADDGTLQGHI